MGLSIDNEELLSADLDDRIELPSLSWHYCCHI